MAKKILIVEDEPDVVTWLKVLFEENGYTTVTANEGASGFEKALSELPDLITLDISMNGESGVKMYGKLGKNDKTKNIPVIMVTAAPHDLSTFMDRMKSKHSPAGFFEKPVDAQELVKKVKELIG